MAINIVQNINDLLSNTLTYASRGGDTARVLKAIEKNLKIFKIQLNKNYHVGVKNCLQSAIATMETLRDKVKSVRVNEGSGNLHNGPHISWSNMQSAFTDCIRTGCINNLKHIDPRYFLNDAKAVFMNKVESVLRKYSFIKVWTTFCGEFVKQSSDAVLVKELKYLRTKTFAINLDTNLNEWYEDNVQRVLLQDLKEFLVSQAFFFFFFNIVQILRECFL